MRNWLNKLSKKYPTHPPNSQPHPALRHLRITFQPDEYMYIMERWQDEPDLRDAYLENLPIYVISHCPFCDVEYKTRLDTHTLISWFGRPADDPADGLGHSVDGRCKHFLAVHAFINLNGIFPDEMRRYFHNEYDVPFISPLFLPEEVPSYSVMHSLPICRIEEGHFVPRYNLYMLTYYVPENYVSWALVPGTKQEFRRGIIAERRKAEHHLEEEYFLYYPFQARKHPEWWDLPLWVKKGKLLWLDPHSPSLELRNGAIDDFPYANIQGYRRGVEIRNGKFRFRD